MGDQFGRQAAIRLFHQNISLSAIEFTIKYTGVTRDKPNPNTTFVVINYGNGNKTDPMALVFDASGIMKVSYTYPAADGNVQAKITVYNDVDTFSQTLSVSNRRGYHLTTMNK